MNVRPLAAALCIACVPSLAHAQVEVKGDPAKAQQIVTQVCAACHGADGNSAIPANPVIAGQHPYYAFKQLQNFKSEDGKKPAERASPVMAGIVASLTKDDMANLALYFGGQEAKSRAARDKELKELGESIYRGGILKRGVAACMSCHGPNGAGIPAQFPRLAGQHSQYTVDQLKAFRAGQRKNDPNRMMRLVAEKLSDREMAAVAQFIEGLR
jgi:cytochrome c553